MADEIEKVETEEVKEDSQEVTEDVKEENEKLEVVPDQPKENGANEIIEKINSLRQELIDYIDLKFSNSKIEDQPEEVEAPKEDPVW